MTAPSNVVSQNLPDILLLSSLNVMYQTLPSILESKSACLSRVWYYHGPKLS